MEDELGLPKSTMQKSIKALLPKEMRVTGDAVDLLIKCCNEFVQLISTQANQACEAEKRSTINAEHIVKALEELDFKQFLPAVQEGGGGAAAAGAGRPAGCALWRPGGPVADGSPPIACTAWDEFKADEKEHQKKQASKRSAAQDSGLTQAQLMELQQKLFAEARARTLSGPLPSLDLTAAAVPVAAAPAAAPPLGGAAGDGSAGAAAAAAPPSAL